MQLLTPANADSSRTRINKLIAELSTVRVRLSVASSETVISKRDAGLRLVPAAANAVSSRTRTAKQRVVPVLETAPVGQEAQIPVNVASSRTRMAVLTAEQSTVTVAANAASSRTVTFRPCVEPKPGVDLANVVSSRVVTCRRRVGQRWATDSKRHIGVMRRMELLAPKQIVKPSFQLTMRRLSINLLGVAYKH